MKHRICLAWFGDLDAPQRERSKPKKESAAVAQTPSRNQRPKVKEAAELRRMFGRD
ncbi:hypothetical protein [Luteolibacter soli]|uniref:Uncharacterized protein n=1 Tax=Luteolibacter soli TaxID=3135280 RepID=A0ABU9ATT6_9BACT